MGNICTYCKRDITKSDGCDIYPVICHGVEYEQIKVGDENDYYENQPGAVCEDCKATYGNYHHPGCDLERCPVCERQLLTCGCLD